jgi:hypothetical protein
MLRDVFDEVAYKVVERVGEATFKSESYVKQQEAADNKVYLMAILKGGVISGETKLGLTLQLFAVALFLIITSHSKSEDPLNTTFCMMLARIGWMMTQSFLLLLKA